MRRRLSLSLLLILLLFRGRADAQLAVIDLGNLAQNTITAAESVLTTIQAILIEANQILELMPLDNIAMANDMAEDMALLLSIASQTEGLSYDVASLRAQITSLFQLETAPDTRQGLTARLAEIKRLKFQVYSYAARTQTLLKTAMRTVAHLHNLLETVAVLIGNMQGNQVHVQFMAVSTKHLANLDVQIAAYYRAETVDKLSDALVIESINKIQARRMADWPGF